MKVIKIDIDKTKKGTPLNHYWSNCVGAGRANEGLRADWQQHLNQVVEACGFRYIRFHGLFHEDMFVYSEKNDTEVFNYQYVDSLFDALLKAGIRPFVEFGFTPKAMASGTKVQFWWQGNVTPPKDFTKWQRLIQRSVKHWVDRYGIEEVTKWYFEVWNEPNLGAFWAGTKSQYFKLYEVTAQAVKSVDQRLKIGGPATSNFVPDDRFNFENERKDMHTTFLAKDIDALEWRGVWIEDFLAYCEDHALPVDFISCHPYPTDFAFDQSGHMKGGTRTQKSLYNDLTWLNKVVDVSGFKDLEIHLTEWSSSPSSRDCSHDHMPAAVYVLKSIVDCIGLVDSLAYWTFTDVFEEVAAGPAAFHGGFGMVNTQGIVKPVFHSYRLLNTLGDHLLDRSDTSIVTTNQESGKISLLAYNYPELHKSAIPIAAYPNRTIAKESEDQGEAFQVQVEIEGTEAGKAYLVEVLDLDHGSVIKAWQEIGSPQFLSIEEEAALKTYALTTDCKVVRAEDKHLSIKVKAGKWGVVAIREL